MAVATPESEVAAKAYAIFYCIPNLDLSHEVGHNLMAPVFACGERPAIERVGKLLITAAERFRHSVKVSI